MTTNNNNTNKLDTKQKTQSLKDKDQTFDENALLPLSQQEIYEKMVHLQTVLLLAQLNAAYQQMNITLGKVFSKVQHKYYKLKMKAFLGMLYADHNRYEIKKKIEEQVLTQRFFRSMIREKGEGNNRKGKGQQESNKKIKILDREQIQLKVTLKSKMILSKVLKLLRNKQMNVLSYSFHAIIKSISQSSTLKYNSSSRSSKIQTIDSHKIFRRSNDKKLAKKSFSVQKSKSNKQQRSSLQLPVQAPIKYQPYKQHNSPILSADYSSNPTSKPNTNQNEIFFDDDENSNLSSQINKFMQSSSNMTPKEKKINLVQLYRNRSNNRSTSNQKLNIMPKLDKKQEAVKELFYLKKKYKKLIAEFNWFSQRFLKVIEEENYVK